MRERNNRMTLRLNDKECQTLKKSSVKVSVPKEVYLRMLIMGTTPKEKPTADFYNMTRELNAIGNSINQIAKGQIQKVLSMLKHTKEMSAD